jgi:DNA-binding NarL/FixJ family response regulator
MTVGRIRILVVDDHSVAREGIAAVIHNQHDMLLVGQASTGAEAIRHFRESKPDITIMELRLPDLCGIDTMLAIRSEFPHARVIILTVITGDFQVQRAIDAGADAYILKSIPTSELVDVIRRVYAGRRAIHPEVAVCMAEHYTDDQLTFREVEVLRQLAVGNRTRDIAKHLSIGEETVKSHIQHIVEKLGANGRAHAVAIGVRRGIVRL